MSTLTRWPLSSHQAGVWAAHQLSGDSLYYTLSVTFRLIGRLDADALVSAVECLVDRHEQLRARFIDVDGLPFQVIEERDPARPVLSRIEVDDEAAAATRIDGVRLAPFDLHEGPLFRAALVRIAPTHHILVLAAHHIVADGASFGILCEDLSVLYGAALVGAPMPLTDVSSRYVDYAARQHHRADPASQAQHLAYWRETLRGAATEGSLYRTVRSAPSRTAQIDVRIPPAVLDAATTLARAESTTLSTVVLSMFARTIVLHGHTDEVLVTLPLSLRRSAELQRVVGFFVDELPVRLRADPWEDPIHTVRRAHDAVTSAIMHADAPFARVLAEIHPERLATSEPLAPFGFQVFMRRPGNTLQLPGVRAQLLPAAAASSPHDLHLRLNRSATLTGTLAYADGIFSAAEAELFRDRLAWATASLLPVGAGPMPGPPAVLRGPEHRPDLLVRREPDGTVVDRFVEMARRQPAAAAIRTDDRTVGYDELRARTAALAVELRRRGVRPADVVAIHSRRGVDLVVAMLGIWRAGGACLPIDPDAPSAWRVELLRDSGAVALICGRGTLTGEWLPDGAIVDLGRVSAGPTDHPAPDVPLDVAFPAYVSYSAGAGGGPLGGVCDHRGLLNSATWMADHFELGPADRVAGVSPVGDSRILGEIVPTLLAGACLEISPAPESSRPARLVRWLRDRAVTFVHLPASFAHEASVAGLAGVPTVRCVAFSGERLRSWPRSRPGLRLVNLYGLAEASFVSTAAELTEPGDRLPPIGQPIDHTHIAVVDRWPDPCGANVPGLLTIGGAGVGSRYLGRPRLTAERFPPDPRGAPGARAFVTGDLARVRVDGQLEYLGRADDRGGIRGHRAEPLAAEVALLRHDGVRAARVVVRCTAGAPPSLVAYYVPTDHSVSAAELRHHLRGVLPSYALPDSFVELAELPRDGNGAINLAALPVPDRVETEEYAPTPALRARERELCELWQNALDIGAVAPTDSFFGLGGTSLAAIRLLSRLQRDGTDLPLHALYSHPTPRSFARLLDQLRNWQAAPYVDVAGMAEQNLELVDGRGAFPARLNRPESAVRGGVVLVGGSHLVDLDGRTFNARPLRDLAEGLASHGWTVFRFEQSFQMPALWPWHRPAEYAEAMHDRVDACRRDLVERQPDAPVVVVGHSLGAALVMTLWHRWVDLAGLVSLSSPPSDLDEVLAPLADGADSARCTCSSSPWAAGLPTLALCGERDARTTPHDRQRWDRLAAEHDALTVTSGDWDHWGLERVPDSFGWVHVSPALVTRVTRWLDDLR